MFNKEIGCILEIFFQAYHAGLKDKERNTAQDEWMSGKTAVIAATG